MISWYPVIDVLKHTSPTVLPRAPHPWPQNTLPSANTKAPLAHAGAAEGASKDAGPCRAGPLVAVFTMVFCHRVWSVARQNH